jgi:hypothetical protein
MRIPGFTGEVSIGASTGIYAGRFPSGPSTSAGVLPAWWFPWLQACCCGGSSGGSGGVIAFSQAWGGSALSRAVGGGGGGQNCVLCAAGCACGCYEGIPICVCRA